MPFITQEFIIKEPKKSFLFIMETLKCSQKEAQKYLDKHRLLQDNRIIHKSEIIQGRVYFNYFYPISKNILPIFTTPFFAVYDKPPKILTHPKGTFEEYSLCDEIKFYFGTDANPIHRLDYETSGLLMVSKDKKYESELKALFENKLVKKIYLALVRGNFSGEKMIDLPILSPKKSDRCEDLGIKSIISKKGKKAITKISPIFYDNNKNITLLKVSPITGRTHQIRVHLNEIGYPIIGDPLYGVSDELARKYLDNKFRQDRLMLHSYSLEFEYKGIKYFIKSESNLLDIY